MSLIDALIKGALAMVNGLLGLFPSYSVSTSVLNTSTGLGAGMAVVDAFMPVALLVGCLTLVTAIWVGGAVLDLVVFVYKLIPFKAS